MSREPTIQGQIIHGPLQKPDPVRAVTGEPDSILMTIVLIQRQMISLIVQPLLHVSF